MPDAEVVPRPPKHPVVLQPPPRVIPSASSTIAREYLGRCVARRIRTARPNRAVTSGILLADRLGAATPDTGIESSNSTTPVATAKARDKSWRVTGGSLVSRPHRTLQLHAIVHVSERLLQSDGTSARCSSYRVPLPCFRLLGVLAWMSERRTRARFMP